MAITPEMIMQVRYELGDTDTALPWLSDDEITYYLTKHSESVVRAAVDGAKVILFRLSSTSDIQVDILAMRGAKTAESYRAALELFIKNPQLNGLLNNVQGYIGGTSLTDVQSNNNNPDNIVVQPPVVDDRSRIYRTASVEAINNPFYI